MVKLRKWQSEALAKAVQWLLVDRQDKHFLINAAPGAGKTITACEIARELFQREEIDRVVVIAPRSEVVKQWARDYEYITRRTMARVTGTDGDVNVLDSDLCATWSAVQGLQSTLARLCQKNRTLVICDEHHHAAVEAAWGESADSAFSSATFVLVLTGTPMRSDGVQSVWLAYDDQGAIKHPPGGTYTLTYGQAVDYNYCRPVTFHRHDGKFTVQLASGETAAVSGEDALRLPDSFKSVPGLKKALDFYKLACTPQFVKGTERPLLSGYQGTMLAAAGEKLNGLRHRMPDAGGLVIAPTIEMAQYFVELIEALEGEAPILVHSHMPNSDSRISAFRRSKKRWLVSVAMVSEGVDIPRLRVLVYLPNARTELAFRQAVGRVIRSASTEDDTRAYVVMPTLEVFDRYARRVEEEIPHHQGLTLDPKTKKCAVCSHENPIGASQCEACENHFPQGPVGMKACPHCDHKLPVGATECHHCGHSFQQNFELQLDEALRSGAIIRGMELSEREVRVSEEMAEVVRERILRSGDPSLINLLRVLPEEALGRLKTIMEIEE